MELGDRIRMLRLKNRMTIKQLSETSGVSKSLVSQIERNLSLPTVTTLQRIARAFGATLSVLFSENASEAVVANQDEELPNSNRIVVVRKDRRRKLITPWGIWYELLCPDLLHKLEVICLHYPVGVKSDEVYNHDGEECGVVLEGRIRGIVGDQTIILEEGDSVYYRSSVPHRWENDGEIEGRAIWAVTPPSY